MNELKHIELENPIVKHKTEKLLEEDWGKKHGHFVEKISRND